MIQPRTDSLAAELPVGYAEAGRGDPPMLLLHGWGTDRGVLKPLFEHAQNSHRVVSVDLRGFGESDAPDQSYTVQGYADDVAFITAELGLKRPIVIGHSMGGMIALDFAARYGDRLSAAVILESMVVAPKPVVARLHHLLDEMRTEGYREVAAGVMNHLTGVHFDATERARLVSFIASCPQNVLVSAMEGIIAFDSVAAAQRVKCPLLYVGTSTTYADVARFRELCPQLVTGQLVGCGHYFPLEVPDQLNAMVGRFIQTHVIGIRAVNSDQP